MFRLSLAAGVWSALLLLPVRADEPKKAAPAEPSVQVPYRLINTLHTLVRVKINGKGPFNFIIDTGAPLLFVATSVGKKIGLSPDKQGWTTLERFELEGGIALDKVKCRVETPFQLEGMNGLGMAGAELHGIIGYTVLAHFRMEFDFTRDTMQWTRLRFEPPPPQGVKTKGGGGAGGLELIGGIMKVLGALSGKKADTEIVPRGYLGIDVSDCKGKVRVQAVRSGSPASKAGLEANDVILLFQGKRVTTTTELRQLAAQVAAGQAVRLTIRRDLNEKEITMTAGEGL